MLDREGRLTRINPEAERILRLPAASVLGRPLAAVQTEGMAEFVTCIQKVLAGGPPRPRHELAIRYNGEQMAVGVSVNSMKSPRGERIGAIAIFRDLTEVNLLRERMREADRLAGVGELAASIAHEVRNPLGSIRGSVEILAGELQLTGHQAQLLGLILKESARVNTIINDFLAFARLRPTQRCWVDGADFLEAVALQIRQHIAAHGDKVCLQWRVEPPDLRLHIDPAQMTQLFLNLAINACEAMDYAGELTLMAAQKDGSAWQELIVCDSGPGVSEEMRDELFKPFVTTKKGGTGLGLPMVARIAHAHHGRVRVGTAPNGGAVFTVQLYPGSEDSETEGPPELTDRGAERRQEIAADVLSTV
jgi:two-component system sensor histidine kinase PilS (NtrC family)